MKNIDQAQQLKGEYVVAVIRGGSECAGQLRGVDRATHIVDIEGRFYNFGEILGIKKIREEGG